MKKFAIVFVSILPLLAIGCNGTGMQWAASEPIRQASDVVEIKADAIGIWLANSDLPQDVKKQVWVWLTQLKDASQAVDDYVGPAKNPPPNNDAGLAVTLAQARRDAVKPPPTIQEAADIGLGIADEHLRLFGGIAAALGFPVGVRLIKRARATTAALRQVTRGIEDLPEPTREVVVAAQRNRQTGATEDIVRDARRVS